MELLLKLLENANTDESIRIICENIRANRQFINALCILFFIVIVLIEIVNLWAMHRLEEKFQKILKDLKE